MKIAVCIPHLRQVEALYSVSLARLMYHTARESRETELAVLPFSSSAVPLSRIRLADHALSNGADALLWTDTDMVFPPAALLRLLSLKLDIVGANYTRRGEPVTPVAHDLQGKPLLTGTGKAQRGVVEKASAIGFGFCLISAKVFRTLERPWFAFVPTPDGNDIITEDYYFCRKAREAGFEVHVDHSIPTGHLSERMLTNFDAFKQGG